MIHNPQISCLHPDVFNTYIIIQWCVSQTQQNFVMCIIVLGRHVSILIESSSGPSEKIGLYLKCLKMRCGIPNAYIIDKTMYKILCVFCEQSKNDSIRSETCRPSTIIYIRKFCFVWLTHGCISIHNLQAAVWIQTTLIRYSRWITGFTSRKIQHFYVVIALLMKFFVLWGITSLGVLYTTNISELLAASMFKVIQQFALKYWHVCTNKYLSYTSRPSFIWRISVWKIPRVVW